MEEDQGYQNIYIEQNYPTGIENEFVACYLEYRGTSLSYNSNITAESMTTEQYIKDVIAVTNYLQERFVQEKIYIMSHSFGTYIGIQTVKKYPEFYNAYIAMAQITNQVDSEKLAYNYMLEQYQSEDNLDMIKKFEAYPIESSDEAYNLYFTSSLRDTAMHELGIGTMHNMNSVIQGVFFPSLRCTVYTQIERMKIWKGKVLHNLPPLQKKYLILMLLMKSLN